jgi:hypothetical protein
MDWAKAPEVFIARETLLGERIFCPVRDGESIDDARRRIGSLWKLRYGRDPVLVPTQTLAALLEAEQRRITAALRPGDLRGEQLAQGIDLLRRWAIGLRQPAADENELRWRLHLGRDAQAALASLVDQDAALRSQFATLPPFELEGGAVDPGRVMLVVDSALVSPGDGVFWKLHRKQWFGDLTEYAALDFWLPPALERLPDQVVVVDDSGSPAVLWNYATTLTEGQIRRLGILPFSVAQLARHVGDRCEKQHGRRPIVRVVSYCKLNHHPMQPIVDSSVDLASEPVRWLEASRWILPLKRADSSIE